MEEEENFQKKQTSPGKKAIYKNKEKILKLYYDGMRPKEILERYDIPESTFFGWTVKYPRSMFKNNNKEYKLSEWVKMKKHLEKIESELSFLKRTVVKKISLNERKKIIDNEYGKESLHIQCEALNVNRGTYLNHKNRSKKENVWFKRRKARCTEMVCEIFEESGRVYGAKKIAAIMRSKGEIISERYVRLLMLESGLRSRRSAENRDYRIIARHSRESAHSSQDIKVSNINQAWVSDTSAVRIKGKYYYICVYIDLYSRKIVGLGIGRNNSTQLVKGVLVRAYKDRNYPKGLIIHTDNGACFSSYSYEQLLNRLRVIHSFSRIGIPHDNAVAESFFATLKRECIYLEGSPRSYRELKERVEKYTEKYNKERPHEHLKYNTPDRYERKHIKNKG